MPALDVRASTLVVAIDGPSGSGKSTVARGVASALGLRYLDTGAMYRALTWWVLHDGADPSDEAAVLARAATFALDISADPGELTVRVNGHDVTSAIRTSAVTRAVSAVSALPDVRLMLVSQQRSIIGGGGIVVEGRDIGTVVCPDAPVKIFLTAAVDTRAERRANEISGSSTSGRSSTGGVAAVQADIERRDRLDSSRTTSPLNQAPDAVALDTTSLNAQEVIAAVLHLIGARTGVIPPASPASPASPAIDPMTFDPIGGQQR